jgi:5-methylcytosine-specific restriction protein B
MNTSNDNVGTQPAWFVGASYGGTDDQMPRFLAEGIWEVRNPTDKESALVNSMKAGERIAIKACSTEASRIPIARSSRPSWPSSWASMRLFQKPLKVYRS